MRSLKSTCAATAVAAAFAVMPGFALAQDCTANVSPSQVEADSDAVMITVSLDQDRGAVEEVEAGTSGIQMASPNDIPRTAMAAEDTEPQPIQEGANQNTWMVWLSTQDVEAGSHPVTFVTEDGERCTAEITVSGAGR